MAEGDPNPDVVQVSRADLSRLEGAFTLFSKLWDDPKHGAAIKQAAKEVNPALRIPEIDVAGPLLAPIREQLAAKDDEIKKIREEFEADKKSREDEKAIGDLSKALDAAQKKYRLTDSGMAEVKKLMAERSIADPMAAAAYVVSEIEPAKPVTGTNFGPTDANVLGIDGSAKDDDTKLLHNDPVKWQDQEIGRILGEFSEQEAA